jgi:hypothetical protein
VRGNDRLSREEELDVAGLVGDRDVVQGEAELRVKETMATNGARSAGEVEVEPD